MKTINPNFSAKCNALARNLQTGDLMDYLKDIEKFIRILLRSKKFHLLCISGAPGWAKTHSTRRFLTELEAPYQMLGAYSTPLALYNHLSEFADQISVIDDTAGLFYNPQALSILNAATWPGIAQNGKRVVTWTSTSEKVTSVHSSMNEKELAFLVEARWRLPDDGWFHHPIQNCDHRRKDSGTEGVHPANNLAPNDQQ